MTSNTPIPWKTVNPCLISAAPELLETLKQIIWKIDQTQGYKAMRKDSVIELGRKAIAKAEGKEVER